MQFYRQAQGIIICFDLTNLDSFENVKTWMLSIYKNAEPNISRILVGNKLDLEVNRIVSKSDCQKLAEEHGMEYFETSAKENLNIHDSMNFMIEKVIDRLFGKDAVQNEEEPKQSVMLGRRPEKPRQGGSGSGGGPCGCGGS